VAFGAEPATIVVAKATFQRLVTGPEQLAEIILEKGAAVPRKLIGGDGPLTALERRGKHPKGQLGGDLQHHPIAISSFEDSGSLLNGPPTGTNTISQANLATAWLRRRIFFR
jgi:hypothetical protein